MNTWPKQIEHVYIICSKEKEPERYKRLVDWFRSHAFDPSSFSFVYLKHATDITPEEAFKVYNPWSNRPKVDKEEHNFNRFNLKLTEISLCINWAAAAATAIKAGHKNSVLILESDPVFEESFFEKLGSAMNLLEGKEWDFLSIGDGVGLKPNRPAGEKDYNWFPPSKEFYHTRTTNAMIFKIDMLKKIMSTYFPFAEVLDWELNYQLQRHTSKSLWLDPILIRNGSSTGLMKTTI